MNNKLVDIASLLFHEHGIDLSIYDDSLLEKPLVKRFTVLGSYTNNNYSNYTKTINREVCLLILLNGCY